MVDAIGEAGFGGNQMALLNRELGDRIAKARLAKGWRQKELARALDKEPTAVSRWERAANDPSLETLVRIAELLGKPMSYFTAHLYEPAPQEGEAGPQELSQLTRQVEALSARVEQLLRQAAAENS